MIIKSHMHHSAAIIFMLLATASVNISAQNKRIVGDYKLEMMQDVLLSDYEVFSPSLLVVTDDNRIAFFDFSRYELFIYSLEDGALLHVGKRGRGPKEFGRIFDIGVDKNGEILLLDTSNNKVIKWDSQGNFKKEIDIGSRSVRPSRLTICEKANLMYILSSQHSRKGIIHQYDKQGTLIKSFNKTESKGLSFVYHTDGQLACDAEGSLYYATRYVNQIKKYNKNGELKYNMPVYDSEPNKNITERDGGFVSLNPGATRFSGDVYYMDGRLYVGYSGRPKNLSRLIDVYKEESQEYVHSIKLPYEFKNFVITEDLIVILREDESEEPFLTVFKYIN